MQECSVAVCTLKNRDMPSSEHFRAMISNAPQMAFQITVRLASTTGAPTPLTPVKVLTSVMAVSNTFLAASASTQSGCSANCDASASASARCVAEAKRAIKVQMIRALSNADCHVVVDIEKTQ